MNSQNDTATRPCAIEPYDKVWGVGISGLQDEISPFKRINEMLEETKTAHRTVDVERLNIVTEAYEKYNAYSPTMKVALTLRDILQKVTVRIDDKELIVGEMAAPAWAAPLYPEFSIKWLQDEMDQIKEGNLPDFDKRANDKYYIDEATRNNIRDVQEFWKGNNVESAIKQAFSEDESKGGTWIGKGVYACDLYTYNGIGHVCAHYEKLLGNGFGAIKKRVEEKLADIKIGDADGTTKREFYGAQLIILEGVHSYFLKYATLAEQLAETAGAQRKKELERIASNCRWLGEGNAPRDFWEAIQLWHMATNLILIESNGHSVTYGRFDQLFYPFYKNDIEKGTLTREMMQELIECSFIKMDHLCKIRDYGNTVIASGINMGGTALDVGGVDERGNDATNEVSYMVLDAHAHTRITNPWMGVRISSKTPEKFKKKLTNVIRIGTGEPKVFNDEQMIAALMNYQKPIEDARNYVGIGCVEPSIPGKSYGWCDATYFSMGKVMELAVNNGQCINCSNKCPRYAMCVGAGKRLGKETGKLSEMKNFEEFKIAFDEQMKYWIDRMISSINTMDVCHQRLKPLPYLSLIMDDCVERGVDVSAGGAIYNHAGPQGVGLGTCADSLATIKQVVFEEKKCTADELIQALKDDWNGHEVLQAYVNSDKVHHYGNNDDYADELAQFVMNSYCQHVEHRPTPHGGEYMPGVYSVSINVALGFFANATPDGRNAGTPLSDCLGPVHTKIASHDIKGATALAASVAKLDQARIGNGVILNWKFSPTAVEGEIGRDCLESLIDVYFAKGGMQSQFNIIGKETLLAAQDDPDSYRNLMVRVAGYSAYFTELSDELQQDLIERTEQVF